MAEGSEEEEFACVVEELQQEDRIELKFQMKFEQKLLTAINHGLSFRKAGQRVQPVLSQSTVASIVRLFRNENRIHTLLHNGGRGKLFSVEQESAIVDMVMANNAIRLCEIQAAVIADHGAFRNINREICVKVYIYSASSLRQGLLSSPRICCLISMPSGGAGIKERVMKRGLMAAADQTLQGKVNFIKLILITSQVAKHNVDLLMDIIYFLGKVDGQQFIFLKELGS